MAGRPDSIVACAPCTLELVGRARALQSCAVIAVAMGSGTTPFCYDMAWALGLALRVVPMAVRVSPYPPEGFIAELPSPKYRDNVLAWTRRLRVGDLLFRFLPWTPTSHAEAANMFYKVRLCIEGVPEHAHQLATVAQLMAPVTLMERIEVDPPEDKDRTCCVVWAWTQDPDGFAKTGTLQLENAPGRMESYWDFNGRGRFLARRERRGPIALLSYPVIIHLDQVVDFRPPSPVNTYSGSRCSSARGSFDNTAWPKTFTFDWALGVPDGQVPPVPRPRLPVHTRLIYRKRDRSPPGGGQGSEEDTTTSARRLDGVGGAGNAGGTGNAGAAGGAAGAGSATGPSKGSHCSKDGGAATVHATLLPLRAKCGGVAAGHAPLVPLLPSPVPHIVPTGGNGQEQDGVTAVEAQDKAGFLTKKMACLELEPTMEDPMLLEAALHGRCEGPPLHRSNSWASLGFVNPTQPTGCGPLLIDPTGIWANSASHMVTSHWTPTPDLLTGPDADPTLKNTHVDVVATSLPILDADAEHVALPNGLLSSPDSTPPDTPLPVTAIPTSTPTPTNTATEQQQTINLTNYQGQDTESEDGALDEYLEDLIFQPAENPEPTVNGMAALIDELMQAAPTPIIAQLPEQVATQVPGKPRRSERLSNKTTSTMTPLQKAQVVLLKKLDMLDDENDAQEEQKLRLLNMFKGDLPEFAVEAMDELINEGNAKGNKQQARVEVV